MFTRYKLDCLYYCFCSWQDLSATFDMCHLGQHTPAGCSTGPVTGGTGASPALLPVKYQQACIPVRQQQQRQIVTGQQLLSREPQAGQQQQQTGKLLQHVPAGSSSVKPPAAAAVAEAEGVGKGFSQQKPYSSATAATAAAGAGVGSATSITSRAFTVQAAWLRGLQQACRQLQLQLLLNPPELQYLPRDLDTWPEGRVVVYVIPPGDDPELLMSSYLVAARYLGPVLPKGDGAAGVGGGGRVGGGGGGNGEGGGGGGSRDLSQGGVGVGLGMEQVGAEVMQQQQQQQSKVVGVGQGVAPVTPDQAEPQDQQQQQQGSCAGQTISHIAGQTSAATGQTLRFASYTDVQGPVHQPVRLIDQQWHPVDCVLQLVKQSTMMLTTEVDLRALAIAVYNKVRFRGNIQEF